MPSLRELLAAHAPLLLIDAASTNVQVGWFESSTAVRWESSQDEAGVAVFRCLEKLGTSVNDAAAFAFCDGPGSILGIRTVAMALRTWCVLKPRPVFAYSSLAVVARAIGRADIGVIADARRDSWHLYQLDHGLRRVPASALPGELVTPESFRNWTPLPPGTRATSYTLPTLVAEVADADLFVAANSPDAFLHEDPTYITWTPQIHRAPRARP